MGVPSFFRWLLEKYPRTIMDVVEEHIKYDDNMDRILPDASQKNPNGFEFDNLYLDMNGIIHPACHPENKEQPKNEDEMILNVFKYIEHIFSIVRPRKLLFMAIDGVAPRAKMNQQRARRFKAAKERNEMELLRDKLEMYYKKKGIEPPPKPKPSWDHNVITPGTPFMDKLAQSLRHWISIKLHKDPAWKHIKVILSDANVPGEGEHKIAAFIRQIRQSKSYDMNTHHVLHGLDADLFMLGLATHEPRFTILREEVLFGKNKPCDKCGQKGHFKDICKNEEKPKTKQDMLQKFVFAHLWILREYLNYELKVNIPWGKWNLERIIDDFVFLCFFVGNDFLPHLPSLDIREGALDLLIKEYKLNLPILNGYLTENGGKICLQRVGILLKKLGKLESQVFINRMEKEKNDETRRINKNKFKREMMYKQKNGNNNNKRGIIDRNDGNGGRKKRKLNDGSIEKIGDSENEDDGEIKDEDLFDKEQLGFMEEFDDIDFQMDDHFMEMDFEHQLKRISRAKNDVRNHKGSDFVDDTVKLGSENWKERYYRQKYHINYSEKDNLLNKICHEYIKGLCWIMLYYYQGCPSWSWFYPFHYSPFASDLININKFEIKFDKGKPFKPFGQLMAVLPAISGKKALPKQYHSLMDSPKSTIIDFYPINFKEDLNGKLYTWQAVVLLPFINENRLLKAINKIDNTLNENQKRMNSIGNTLIFVNTCNSLAKIMVPLQLKMSKIDDNKDSNDDSNIVKDKIEIDQTLSHGLNGFIGYHKQGILPNNKLEPYYKLSCLETKPKGVSVISTTYHLPKYQPHNANLLDGITPMDTVLTKSDFDYMENSDRFGKPRQRRRRDTHFNYNRGWDWAQGYMGGSYKAHQNAKKIKNRDGYMPHYQPTRIEYNDMLNNNNNNDNNSNIKEYKPNKKFPKFYPYPTKGDPYKWNPPNSSKQPIINDNNNYKQRNYNKNDKYNNNKRDYNRNNYGNNNFRNNNNNNNYQRSRQSQNNPYMSGQQKPIMYQQNYIGYNQQQPNYNNYPPYPTNNFYPQPRQPTQTQNYQNMNNYRGNIGYQQQNLPPPPQQFPTQQPTQQTTQIPQNQSRQQPRRRWG